MSPKKLPFVHDRIEHELYGPGTVVGFNKIGIPTICVRFDDFPGTKTFLWGKVAKRFTKIKQQQEGQ